MNDLRFTPENYRILFESSPNGLFVVNSDKMVVDANTLALDILKYSRKELLNKTCHQFICPKHKGKCPVFDMGEEVYNIETVIIRKDKVRIPVIKSCQKIALDDSFFVIEGFVDISERKIIEEEKKKLQEQLFHAQKMEAIGILAGGVAHEFRNILTPILGYAELLGETVTDGQDKEALDIIKRSAQRGADISNQIISFSKKAPALNLVKVDIHKQVKNITAILKSTIAKFIDIHIAYNTHTKIIVADPSLLEQAFMNLSINACEAMQKGGKLTFEVNLVKSSDCCFKSEALEKYPKYLQISVIDTGMGMDNNVKEHAFDPFFTTKGPKGTGLGLFMVYNIIEQHGGCITILSRKGHGTRFNIYLPLKYDISIDSKKVRQPSVCGIRDKSTCVLIVEDEDNIRKMMSKLLKKSGFDVIEAGTGKEAVDLFNQRADEVGIVVLDLVLPDFSGIEVYNKLIKKNKDLKVIITSGYSSDIDEIRNIIDSLAVEYIPKPYTPRMLIDMIHSMLNKKRSGLTI